MRFYNFTHVHDLYRDPMCLFFYEVRSLTFESRNLVYFVALTSNDDYLESASDKCMNIWSVKKNKIVKTYNGDGSTFNVCWNKEGNKVATSFVNNKVCVVDIQS